MELGYDRSIPPWEPTPARLIPTLNPAKVAGDLVNAIGEGINNAAALIGSPPPTGKSTAGPAADAGAASLMNTDSAFVDVSLNGEHQQRQQSTTASTDNGSDDNGSSRQRQQRRQRTTAAVDNGGSDNGSDDSDNGGSGDNGGNDNGGSDNGDNDNSDNDSVDNGGADNGGSDNGSATTTTRQRRQRQRRQRQRRQASHPCRLIEFDPSIFTLGNRASLSPRRCPICCLFFP